VFRGISDRNAGGQKNMRTILTVIAALVVPILALDNGLARKPPLGWSTWLTCEDDKECGHDVCNEAEVKASALALQSNGMQALGWHYIVLDDCWAYARNTTTGRLTWDASRFPSGMPALVEWMHERNFLLGLYTSAGNETCSSGGRPITVPGSRGHYDVDAQTFADWRVDYVKLDWCGDVKHEPWVGPSAHHEFATAMNATGRPMILEVVAGYFFTGPAQVASVANVWRFCEDHHDSWKSTAENVLCREDQGARSSLPGGWGYMDVLTTGGAGCSLAAHCPGQTEDEYRTEFAIWTLTQSPLMIATDVRNMSSLAQATLLNAEILSVHQSTATLPGRRLATAADACALPALCAVWGRALDAAGTTWILALVNLDNISVQEVSVSFADLGWNASAMAGALVRDLWARHDLPDATGGKVTARVPTHGTALLRVERIGSRDP